MFKLFERFKRKAEPIVLLTEQGFVVRQGETVLREFVWAEIGEVIAYKQDLFTIDMIVLSFRNETDGPDGFFFVGEMTAGYQELAAAMMEALPDCNPTWYLQVVQPPFEVCLTPVYKKAEK